MNDSDDGARRCRLDGAEGAGRAKNWKPGKLACWGAPGSQDFRFSGSRRPHPHSCGAASRVRRRRVLHSAHLRANLSSDRVRSGNRGGRGDGRTKASPRAPGARTGRDDELKGPRRGGGPCGSAMPPNLQRLRLDGPDDRDPQLNPTPLDHRRIAPGQSRTTNKEAPRRRRPRARRARSGARRRNAW